MISAFTIASTLILITSGFASTVSSFSPASRFFCFTLCLRDFFCLPELPVQPPRITNAKPKRAGEKSHAFSHFGFLSFLTDDLRIPRPQAADPSESSPSVSCTIASKLRVSGSVQLIYSHNSFHHSPLISAAQASHQSATSLPGSDARELLRESFRTDASVLMP